jgi:biotin synthase
MEKLKPIIPGAENGNTKTEEVYLKEKIERVKILWGTLLSCWEEQGTTEDPLAKLSEETIQNEDNFKETVVEILHCSDEEAEILYEEARKIRNINIGDTVRLRATVQVTNVCRENCLCCPMRRDNLNPEVIKRMSSSEIVSAVDRAYAVGIRDMFIQGGEDVVTVPVVVQALKAVYEKYSDIEVVLNLGNLSREQYQSFSDAGVKKYVIKYETSNPKIHEGLRQSPIEKRMQHTLYARQAGLEIGSGNIIGLPEQTDEDLASDILLLGRLGVKNMISSTTYTSSEVLPEPYRSQQAGDWEKSKRFIALLRICFPSANIEAPSNVDGSKIIRAKKEILGQTELIMAGANEIMVEFTPREMAENYGLYDTGEKRHVINIVKAKDVLEEVEHKKSEL